MRDPDKGSKYVRSILGWSANYPYPRRERTGCPQTKKGLLFRSCFSSFNLVVPFKFEVKINRILQIPNPTNN
ncbi:hypothetical protein CsSME_00010725 [Camellia sinensis var. sinensis]